MGEQAIVVPAIEESETLNIKNLNEILSFFRDTFPQVEIDCLHGQLSSDEKMISLEKFKENKTKILIATSIVEVGIDIHNATIMAIYGPERFGLASLHQLEVELEEEKSQVSFFF